MRRRSTEPRSIGEAIERVSDAGQRVAARQIDLLILEAKSQAARIVAALAALAIASFGWVYVVEGISGALAGMYPEPAVETVIGILHLAAAGLVLLMLRRRQAPGRGRD